MKHKTYKVSGEEFTSMCETCSHCPGGSNVPITNLQKKQGMEIQPNLYCKEASYIPYRNVDDEGTPFFDVAECDLYKAKRSKKNG